MAKLALSPQSMLPLATRTTSGTTSGYNAAKFKTVNLFLRVTNVQGSSPQMNATLMTSPDNVEYYVVSSFAPISAIGNYILTASETGGISRYIRVDYTIIGDSAFTFSLDFVAHEEF